MNYNFPICFFDAPEIVDTTVTPIPGKASLPLQVIADSGFRSAIRIDYTDTTGDFIGVYTGAPGQEVLQCIIGGGSPNGWAYAVFAAHSRVSLRSMTPSAITNGSVFGALMGY